jgi:hypothetical protein
MVILAPPHCLCFFPPNPSSCRRMPQRDHQLQRRPASVAALGIACQHGRQPADNLAQPCLAVSTPTFLRGRWYQSWRRQQRLRGRRRTGRAARRRPSRPGPRPRHQGAAAAAPGAGQRRPQWPPRGRPALGQTAASAGTRCASAAAGLRLSVSACLPAERHGGGHAPSTASRSANSATPAASMNARWAGGLFLSRADRAPTALVRGSACVSARAMCSRPGSASCSTSCRHRQHK